MISLTDYWILKLSLHEGLSTPKGLFPLLKEAFVKEVDLKNLLLKNNLLTQPQWKNLLEKSLHLPFWPERREAFNRDNSIIFQYLHQNQVLTPDLLKENLMTCQRLHNPHRSLRLDELLVKKGLVEPSQIKKLINVHSAFALQCPSCHYRIRLERFYPWWKLPCLLTNHEMIPLSSKREELNPPTLISESPQENSTRIFPNSPKEYTEKSQLGRYEILELLGEGGMGAVYKAYDPQLEREVALKVITEPKSGKGSEYLERFKKEVKLAASLSHPAIIPVYDFGEVEGMPYFTMACIEGIDLRSYVEEKGRLAERQALKIIERLVEAVALAHSKGIIHRDIKPENIMITSSGQPVLMDFGLARQTREQNTRITQTGAIMGSPEFMAPEQALGEVDITFAADIYALGGTLFFMLAGRPAFQAKEVYHLLKKVIDDSPPSLTSLNPRIRKEVASLVSKCLQKKPKHRYPSAEELLRELQPLQMGSPLQGSGKYLASPQKKSKTGILLFFFCVLALSVVAFLVISQNKKRPSPSLPGKGPRNHPTPLKTPSPETARLMKEGLAKYRRGEWEEALNFLNRIPQDSSLFPEARIYQALALANWNHVEEAIQEMKRMPSPGPLPDKLNLLKAYIHLEKGEYAQALEIYQELDKKGLLDPDLELGKALYGYWQTGDPKKGLEFTKRGLEINPEHLDMMVFRLNFLQLTCQFFEMVREANRGLKFHPQSYFLYLSRSIGYSALDSTDRSKKDLKKAQELIEEKLKKAPNHQYDLQVYLAVLYQQSNHEKLRALCLSSLKKPERRDFYYLFHHSLAVSFLNQKIYDQAEKHFYQADLFLKKEKKRYALWRSLYYENLFYWGVCLYKAGKIKGAEKLLEQAKSLRPGHSNTHYWLAQVYWSRKEYKKAVLILVNYLRENPGNISISQLLCSYYVAYKDYKGYYRFTQNIGSRLHHNIGGYEMEINGILYYLKQNSSILTMEAREKLYKKAIELSTQALGWHPRWGYFYYIRGFIRFRIFKDFPQAKDDFKKALQYGKNQSYREKTKQMLEKINNPQTPIQLFQGYFERGDFIRAVEAYKKISPRDPQFQKARLYHALAQAYLYNLEIARKEYAEIQISCPLPDKLQILKAYLFLEERKHREAMQIYQTLTAKGIQDPDLFLGMGLHYYWKSGDFQKAAPYIDRALKIVPERMDLVIYRLLFLTSACKFYQLHYEANHYLKKSENYQLFLFRAKAFLELGYPSKALEDKKKALEKISIQIEIFPENLRVLSTTLSLSIETGQSKKTFEVCQYKLQQARHKSYDFLYCYYMGLIYNKSMNYKKAEEILKRALKLMEPRLAEGHEIVELHKSALYTLGTLLVRQRRVKEAEPLLLKLKKDWPDFSSPHHWLFQIYWARKDEARAIEILENYMKRNPTNIYNAKTLSSMYAYKRMYQKGLSFSEDAARRFNYHPNGYYIELQAKANMYFLVKQPEEKKKILLNDLRRLSEEGLKQYTKKYFLYYFRGIYYAATGKAPQAIKDLKIAAQKCQAQSLRKEATRVIKQIEDQLNRKK